MTITGVRISALLLVVLGLLLAVHQRARVRTLLTAFLFEPSSAFNLGVLRAVVFSTIFSLASKGHPTFFATLPAGLRVMPPGWGWLEGLLPFDEPSVRFAQSALLISSALATVGLATAVSTATAALLALFVLGVPNFYIKIDHSAHILMLCALVIAVSRSGDAVALDRLFKGRRAPPPPPSVAYTIPMRFCWLLIGTVYLFPGAWKVWESGDMWLSGLQLQGELWDKWGQLEHFTPPFRIDQYPRLLTVLGIATVAFELSVFFLILKRSTRVLAALAAVGFHLGVKLFLAIQFHVFFPLVLLLDFPQLWLQLRRYLPLAWRTKLEALFGRSSTSDGPPAPPEASAPRPSWPRAAIAPLLMGSLLLTGQWVTGLAHVDSWPVSLHPTFSARQKEIRPRVKSSVVVVEPGDQSPTREIPEGPLKQLGGARLERLFRKVRGVAISKEKHPEDGRIVIGLLEHMGVETKPGDVIAVYKAEWDVFPLGQRTNYTRSLTRRLRIQDDLSLTPLFDEARKRKAQ